jgi:heme exporter protein A
MLEALDLECTRGDRRLFKHLTFQLERGELLHLHGHNGSGKTTLMRTVCGLIAPSAGEIHWQGTNIRRQREEFARDLVYIGHKDAIKADLTGTENLRIACQLDGQPISETEAWDALERMGLRGHEDLPARVLSQGQKKRVALARLLLNRSPLWILDEPFIALDKAAVALLESLIQEHLNQGGMVMITTHQDVPLTSGQVKQLQLGWKREGDV